MTKKKRFGISAALTQGLSETIKVVENNPGVFRNVILPLSRIELDPENPRKLAIDLHDVRNGLKQGDPLYNQKQAELERLKELAHTIQSSGIINPIVVYKNGDVYRIVAGERRSLAAIIANKQEIEARVFTDKPKSFDLKLLQWVENTSREDLSLHERLENVRDMMHAYRIEYPQTEIRATLLKTVTGLSLPQCTYYLAALNAPQDVQRAIAAAEVRNLDKAALLAGIEDKVLRQQALELCKNGASLKNLRQLISEQVTAPVKLSAVAKRQQSDKVALQFAASPAALKKMFDCLLAHKSLSNYQMRFKQLNWRNVKEVQAAFKQLIQLLENEVV